MLSTPLHHQYAPTFTSLPSSSSVISHTGHLQHHVLSSPDMDSLGGAPGPYALQNLHHQSITGHHPLQSPKMTMKGRHHPYTNNSNYASVVGVGGRGSDDRNSSAMASAGPVRRRISRACDQCNQLRTKCDRKLPCAHCVGEQPSFNFI